MTTISVRFAITRVACAQEYRMVQEQLGAGDCGPPTQHIICQAFQAPLLQSARGYEL